MSKEHRAIRFVPPAISRLVEHLRTLEPIALYGYAKLDGKEDLMQAETIIAELAEESSDIDESLSLIVRAQRLPDDLVTELSRWNAVLRDTVDDLSKDVHPQLALDELEELEEVERDSASLEAEFGGLIPPTEMKGLLEGRRARLESCRSKGSRHKLQNLNRHWKTFRDRSTGLLPLPALASRISAENDLAEMIITQNQMVPSGLANAMPAERHGDAEVTGGKPELEKIDRARLPRQVIRIGDFIAQENLQGRDPSVGDIQNHLKSKYPGEGVSGEHARRLISRNLLPLGFQNIGQQGYRAPANW